MNNFKFLLLGTSLSFIPLTVNAQCVATQDCETLGYTETICNGGKGVKCPFGNKWACLPTETEICKKNGFTESCTGTGQSGSGKSCGGLYAECSCASSYQYSCTGTGYAGGAGSACGDKYIQCKCAAEYEWKDGSCQQKITNGIHGDFYYCNSEIVALKTPNMNFYISIENATSKYWDEADRRAQYYIPCIEEGKLPTLEQLRTIYDNKETLNNLLVHNGGEKILDAYYWSSTIRETTGNQHYLMNMLNGATISHTADMSIETDNFRSIFIP